LAELQVIAEQVAILEARRRNLEDSIEVLRALRANLDCAPGDYPR